MIFTFLVTGWNFILFRFRIVNHHFNVNLIFSKFFDKGSGRAERRTKRKILEHLILNFELPPGLEPGP